MALTNTSRIPTDPLSGATVQEDRGHYEIHSGNSYTAYFANTTAATNGHRSGLYIKTPATKSLHGVIGFSSSVGANLAICEAPTIAANVGTHTSVPYNRNRNSASESTILNNATSPAAGKFTTLTEAQIAADGTFATGTVLKTAPIYAGTGVATVGGSDRDTQEFVLKQNTAYIFLITNTVATANAHLIQFDWYEV